MTPLIQAPSVIPQLILSLCTVSIATCNKLFENMMLFNGDNKDTRIIGTVNGKKLLLENQHRVCGYLYEH